MKRVRTRSRQNRAARVRSSDESVAPSRSTVPAGGSSSARQTWISSSARSQRAARSATSRVVRQGEDREQQRLALGPPRGGEGLRRFGKRGVDTREQAEQERRQLGDAGTLDHL